MAPPEAPFLISSMPRRWLARNAAVGPADLVGRPALDDRAGHVRVVAAGRRARKDVEDDALVGTDRSGTLIVRVDALVAAGDDRVLGDAVVLHQRDVHRLLEILRGERTALVEHLVAPDDALPQHLQRGLERGFGVALGLFDRRDLLRSLDQALRQARGRPRRARVA